MSSDGDSLSRQTGAGCSAGEVAVFSSAAASSSTGAAASAAEPKVLSLLLSPIPVGRVSDRNTQALPAVTAAPGSPTREVAPEFSVRRAIPTDAAFFAEIAALVNINSYSQFDRGFLLYSLSEEEYRERISRGDECFVLLCNDCPIGFLAAILQSEIRSQIVATPGEHLVFEEIERCSSEMKLDRYLFVDQAAILPEYQNRGFGEQLFAQLADEIPGPYFCDILEAPLRNPRVRYWMRRGFKKISEVREAAPERFLRAESTLSRADLLTWGIYFLPTEGWRPVRSR